VPEADEQDLLPLPARFGAVLKKGSQRDREAARLKALGWDVWRIGEHLGLDSDPEHTEARVTAAIKRALALTVRFGNDESRWLELKGLEELELYLWRLLGTSVVLVQHGRIVSVDGKALTDHRFALEVVDRICRVKEQKAKLGGWNAPTRTEVISIDSVNAEIEKLEADLAAHAARGEE
jgi:hypothetical protein